MSTSQFLTPELREWVAAQLRNGITREALYQAMLSSGWQADLAQQALALLLEPVLLVHAGNVDHLRLLEDRPQRVLDGEVDLVRAERAARDQQRL